MKQKEKKPTRRGRYTAGIMVVVLVFFITVSYFAMIMTQMVRKNTASFFHEMAYNQASWFYSKINDQIGILETIGFNFRNVDLNDYNAVKETICSTRGVGDFELITIADRTGFAIGNDNMMAGNISRMNYYLQSMSGKVSISEGKGMIVDDEKIVLSVPVYKGSEVAGVLSGTFDRDMLYSQFDMSFLTGKGHACIFDSDGVIIVQDRKDGMLPEGDNLAEYVRDYGINGKEAYSEFLMNVKGGNSGTVVYNWGGERVYGAYQPIGIQDWYVMSIMENEVITEQSTQMGLTIFTLFGISTILFLTFALLLYRYAGNKYRNLYLEYVAQHPTPPEPEAPTPTPVEGIDPVTGLYSMNGFSLRARGHYEQESEVTAAFFLIEIADSGRKKQGEEAWNRVLEECGTCLNRIFNEEDYVGRLDEHRFAVLMKVGENFFAEGFDRLVRRKAAQVVKSLSEVSGAGERRHGNVTACVGVSISPRDGKDYAVVRSRSEMALHEAQEAGPGNYKVY